MNTPASRIDPESRGVHPRSPTPGQLDDLARALTYFPPDALRGANGRGIDVVWESQPSPDGRAGDCEVFEDPAAAVTPKVRLFPWPGSETSPEDRIVTLVHELCHHWLGTTRLEEARRVWQTLSPSEKQAAIVSQYAASPDFDPEEDMRPGSTAGGEIACEALTYWLQNRRCEAGEPLLPARERLPRPLRDLFDRWFREAGGTTLALSFYLDEVAPARPFCLAR